jgi:hypothetical protein
MGKAFIRCIADTAANFSAGVTAVTLSPPTLYGLYLSGRPSRSGGVVGKVPQIKYLRFKPDQLEVD